MRKILFATLFLIFGISMGIGAAYGFSKIWQPVTVSAAAPVNVQASAPLPTNTALPPSTAPQTQGSALPNQAWNNNGWGMGYGMTPAPASGAGVDDWGRRGNATPGLQNGYMGSAMMGHGMMGGWNNNSGQGYWGMGSGMMGRGMGPGMMSNGSGNTPTGQRLTIDQAIESAKQYIASYGQGLAVAEIMEFNNNFYVAVKETVTGRGAFELLVDPVSGAVLPEVGPNMMWNIKYGPMGSGQNVENTLSLEQAAAQGQKFLDANAAGAKLQPDGTNFYGHYTFDYKVNDQVAGMLSVNGFDGSVWLHTWHGQFIAEQEVK